MVLYHVFLVLSTKISVKLSAGLERELNRGVFTVSVVGNGDLIAAVERVYYIHNVIDACDGLAVNLGDNVVDLEILRRIRACAGLITCGPNS